MKSVSQSSRSESTASIKQKVKEKLDKNPLLTPKQLCHLCQLPYTKYADYVSHIKTEWKYDFERQHGSKPSIHAWRGWTYLPGSVGVESKAMVGVGVFCRV